MNQPDHEEQPRGFRWLSSDYAKLREPYAEVIDVLIVGSGYGGAMAAAELAGLEVVTDDQGNRRKARIVVLERGNEYVPGMFASSLQELPPHVRVHVRGSEATMGRLDALLDVRAGPDVCTLTGNGLGGGSLINAGVMEKPRLSDCKRLPDALREALNGAFLDGVMTQLGATDALAAAHPTARKGLAKTAAMQALYDAAKKVNPGLEFRPAAITVQVARDDDDPDVPPCTLCGDCMTGCNVGAKKSLDTTLLRQARRKGAEIYTGGSVIRVSRNDGGGWKVRTVYTDKALRERHRPVDILAHRVILAAGTLGSTEILMRSRRPELHFSRKLGEQFSCNGDNLVALHDGRTPTNTTADESQRLDARSVGPTITSVLQADGMLLQEFAVPAPLKRLFGEIVTTARLLNDLSKGPSLSRPGAGGCDSFAIDAAAMDRTLLVGLIGHDESAGQLQLESSNRDANGLHAEGHLGVQWPAVRSSFQMAESFEAARRIVSAARGAAAPFLPNPLWRLLPKEMEFLLKGERGPVLTVHPLGGCPMGASHLDGVVDDCGRVYDPKAGHDDAQAAAVHFGLAVLDGSIIPASLGANPALTIAAVAKRAAGLLAVDWKLHPAQQVPNAAQQVPSAAQQPVPRTRPVFRQPHECTPLAAKHTKVELTERLIGRSGQHLLELTLAYSPASVAELISGERPPLVVDGQRSFLRVYPRDFAPELKMASEPQRDDAALLVARVAGDLKIMQQELQLGVRGYPAKIRAVCCYGINRGTREWAERRAQKKRDPQGQSLRLRQIWDAAGRAAEARLFRYQMQIGEILKDTSAKLEVAQGDKLRGVKRLTYGLWSNPWRQLTEMKLVEVPGRLRKGTLQLDGRFLAREGTPLLRITEQENQVTALAELVSWGACWVRMLLSIHLWSFRAPDPAPEPARRQLLPSAVAGRLPAPLITEIELDAPRRGVPVRLRLTRYEGKGRPIALIHGYSASGTTFTHEAVPMPLALYLRDRGFDVWVLDLRTSAGMPSSCIPWHFEDAALADIPVAIAHISKQRDGAKVDVIAHCIGAVMLSTAILADPNLSQFNSVDVSDNGARPKRYPAELALLPARLGKIVLSQKAPVLAYSDGNVLRAYFMKLLRRAVPQDFQFTVPARTDLASGVLDRLLFTLPYPRHEVRRENPLWPWSRAPWAGFRHRMDALYARDFSLKNIADETLRSIHELFGPLNLETVAQAIHFARHGTITDGAGGAVDSQGLSLQRWPRNGTFYVHGVENGLADIATLDMFEKHMARAGITVDVLPVAGYGHQDCLIGVGADRHVFGPICKFLGSAYVAIRPAAPAAATSSPPPAPAPAPGAAGGSSGPNEPVAGAVQPADL